MNNNPQTTKTFHNLGINPKILEILSRNNFTIPTPIQHQVIPSALEGKDVVGIAQTGTGKTLAFGIPIIQHILNHHGQALVLVPTRELAFQVSEMLIKIGRPLNIRTAVVVGGASMGNQLRDLRSNPHIVIATPGRLMDFLQQRQFTLQRTQIIVLDEADRMFDIGFMPQIKKILQAAPTERQTMLFSATMPSEIAKIAAVHMKIPLRIEVAPAGTASANVEHEIFIISKDSKLQLLETILSKNPGTVLVFSRTKHGAKRIAAMVRFMGHTAAEIHSNLSLNQRRNSLEGFKSGRFRVLVATDIAARGIDVKEISLVINFDLPENSEDYVHRIGRTGRAGKTGKAISFATPDQRSNLRSIERLMKKALPILAVPVLAPKRNVPAHLPSQDPPQRNYQPRKNEGNNWRRRRGRR